MSFSLLIHLPVWGERYITYSKNLLFPTLFNESNLDALKVFDRCKFIIHTDPESITALKEIVREFDHGPLDVSVLSIFNDAFDDSGDKYGGKKYSRVTRSQNLALESAKEMKNAYYIPLYGDFIIAENLMQTCVEKINMGFTTFLSLVPAVSSSKVYELFPHKTKSHEHFTNKEVLDVIHTCLHPLFYKSIYGYDVDFHPVGPYLGIGSHNAFSMKSFHYHPIFLKINPHESYHIDGTIDENLIPQLPLSALSCVFNTPQQTNLISLMDDDYPMPFKYTDDHLEFYKFMAEKFDNYDKMVFVLSHTSVFKFGKDEVDFEKHVRLEKFYKYLCEISPKSYPQSSLKDYDHVMQIGKVKVALKIFFRLLSKLVPRKLKPMIVRITPLKLLKFILN